MDNQTRVAVDLITYLLYLDSIKHCVFKIETRFACYTFDINRFS